MKCSKCGSPNIYNDWEYGVIVPACRTCGERDYHGNKFTKEEIVKKGICGNCLREISCSSITGLCSFCERTRNEGMAKGASAEYALEVAFGIAKNIKTGNRTAHLLPWNKEGWKQDNEKQSPLEDSLIYKAENEKKHKLDMQDKENDEARQRFKEKCSSNPSTVKIDEISYFPMMISIGLNSEPAIMEMLQRRMIKNRRSRMSDEILAILDAQVAADREEAA
jgi:hypothetical protein